MAGIRIVTDSACDLPAATASEHGITVVPLTIRIDGTEYVDLRDITPREFWEKSAHCKQLPETAAPSPGAFEEAYRAAAADGASGVVCVTLSSELSATFQSAQLGADAVKDTIPVRVIDGRSVTYAQGLLAIAGAEAAAAGKSIDEVAAVIESKVPRMRVFAALDTLENLKKGGRIGAARAALGSMLNIKPLIQLENGAVGEAGKQRTRSRSLTQLIEIGKQHHAADAKPLGVLHSGAPDIEQFVDELCKTLGCSRDDIVVGEIGPVVATHAGPRVIGIAYDESV